MMGAARGASRRRRRTWLDVRDLGVTPNAGTDQQSAIQSAINSAASASRPLYFPAGVYLHSERLTVTGAVLFGDGNDKSIIRGTAYILHAIDLRGTGPGLYNLTIEGMGKANRSSDRGGNGIYILNCTGYVVKNCIIRNVSGCGIMTEFGNGGKILNNYVELTGADGIYQTESTQNLEVAYNRTNITGDDAISFTSYSVGAIVHDIDVHHNSVIGNFESRSITVNGGSAINIHDNHVDGGTAGISVGATTAWGSTQNTNITVSNNVIRDCTYTGEGTIGGGSLHLYNNQTGTDTGITMTGNDIYNSARWGIYVWGTNQINATVTGNNFYQVSARTVFVNANAGATQITENNNPRFEPGTYPGDKIAPDVGGLLPTFLF